MSEEKTGLTIKTPPMHVQAGTHRVTAAFIQRFEGLINDLIAPIDHTMADTEIGTAYGITTLPHLRSLSIVGPHRVTGVSPTRSSRRRDLHVPADCTRPKRRPAPTSIVRRLATQAFRRPVSDKDFARLMTFYARGRKERELRVRHHQGARSDPRQPAVPVPRRGDAAARARRGDAGYRLGDYELASRLSFFLWGGGPDAELLKAAAQGRLRAAGRAGQAGEADAGRPARRRAVHALCVAVAAPAGSREGDSGSDPVSRTRIRRCRWR